jgi:hypothetical protein
MGKFGDTMHSLRDGNTSDGKFWIAIIVIVAAAALLLSCIIMAILFRRHRRKKRLEQEMNDLEPSQLWQQDATAPLPGSHRLQMGVRGCL